MIKNNIKNLAACIAACAMLTACSEKDEGVQPPIVEEDGIPVVVGTRAVLPDGMECNLYIYGKGTEAGEYTLERVVPFDGQDTKQVPFTPAPPSGYWYRFMFVSAVPTNTEIALSGVTTGSGWDDVRFTAANPNITGDYYYAVRDYTYQDLIDAGLISVELNRLVGQVAIDFWREGGKQHASTVSALDRVSEIQIKYTGLAKEISFDATGNPVTVDTWAAETQTIIPVQGTNYVVSIPQEAIGLVTSPTVTAEGNVRIMGWRNLPSDKVRLECTFDYFDTTPVASNPDGFDSRVLTLHLPALNVLDVELPRIKPDILTVHRARIPLDRIIDVPLNVGTDFNLTWENGI